MKTIGNKNKWFTAVVFFGVFAATFVFSGNQKAGRNEKHYKESIIQTETANNSTAVENGNYLIERVREYLEDLEEPALTISNMPEINFPEKPVNTKKNKTGENEYLETLAEQKVQRVIQDYELVLKTKELLVLESEEKLDVEDWMVNETCWCTSSKPILMARK